MKKIILFVAIIIIAGRVFSQSLKDTLFFTNGSKIIGEIKKIKLGVITFDPDDANDITVQLRKLKSISATRTVFRIQTTDDRVYFGQLIASSLEHFVRLIGSDTAVLHIEEITDLYPYKSAFIQRFSGNVGIGFSYTRSSDFGQFNFNGKLNYISRNDQISLSTSGIYTITDSTFVRDREEISLLYNHYFSPTWFAITFLRYQRNLQLGLERRYQEGIGMGNKFLTSKQVYAWAGSGLVINQEKNTENVSSGTLSEIFGEFQFNFFRFTKPEIKFVMTQSFYYGVSQNGRFRNDGETDLYWELIKDLKLDLTFYNNYDSQPALAESRKFDFGVVFGLSFTF